MNKPINENEVGRDHVEWETFLKPRAYLLFCCLPFWDDVGHQVFVFTFFSTHNHHTGIDLSQLQQGSFNGLPGNQQSKVRQSVATVILYTICPLDTMKSPFFSYHHLCFDRIAPYLDH